jgi:hypothetical protein
MVTPPRSLMCPQPQRSPLPGAAEHDPDGPHVCAQVVDEVAQALAHLLV